MFKVKYLSFLMGISLVVISPSGNADQASGKTYTPKVVKSSSGGKVNVVTPKRQTTKKRFTRKKNSVIDHKYRLIWQDTKDNKTLKKTWYTRASNANCTSPALSPSPTVTCKDTSGNTAATYCKILLLDGHLNWRLPSIKELQSLVHQSYLPKVFKNTSSANYWSSTTVGNQLDTAFIINRKGAKASAKKLENYNVRCVRSL